jgi:hypothetical protein
MFAIRSYRDAIRNRGFYVSSPLKSGSVTKVASPRDTKMRRAKRELSGQWRTEDRKQRAAIEDRSAFAKASADRGIERFSLQRSEDGSQRAARE